MIENEQELFNYIKGWYLSDLEKSKDQYDSHDCTSTIYRLHIELKCRHTHYEELILERDKYEALTQEAERLGFTPFYVNATPKGIYAFNLKKTKVTWRLKNCLLRQSLTARARLIRPWALLPVAEAVQL